MNASRLTSILSYLFCAISLLVFALFTYTSIGVINSGDGIQHYQIARFSWQHPHLFLNHWGKPLFTLLSSPFAQFGFKGMMFFNSILGVLTAFFTYKTAKKLNIQGATLSIILVCFCPIYFKMVLAGMTEILFSFLLVLCIYLFLVGKFIPTAIILSFLPFARSEAYVILPLFAFCFIVRKQFKLLPLFGLGYAIYSIVGYFHFDDLFWVSNNNPYKGAKAIYGSGELLHFVKHYKRLWGYALSILIIPGLIYLVYLFITKRREHPYLLELIVLVAGSFSGILCMHSYLWWKGLYGSLGLIRVMAMVVPSTIIIGLFALQWLKPISSKIRGFTAIITAIISLLVIVQTLKQTRYPITLDRPQLLLQKAANWFNKTDLRENKVFYQYPFLGYLCDFDPFDNKNSALNWGLDRSDPAKSQKPRTVIMWDSKFGPKESKLPLDKLTNNPKIKLIQSFKPTGKPIYFYDSILFEVHVFQITN